MRYAALSLCLVVVALAMATAVAARAQSPAAAPVYQRMRGGADVGRGYGGGRHGRFGYGGFYAPFYAAPPIVAGSWYQRPYPYHLDYYRYQWGGADAGYSAAPPMAPDCPCALAPADTAQ